MAGSRDGGNGRSSLGGLRGAGLLEAELLEECAFNAWPALRIVLCDGWMPRFSDGYTKRANSANALSTAGPFAPMLRMSDAFYPAFGLPLVVFRLSPLAAGEPDAVLARGPAPVRRAPGDDRTDRREGRHRRPLAILMS